MTDSRDPLAFTATARQLGSTWLIETDHPEVPSATVRRYNAAEAQVIELISQTLNVPAEKITVSITPQLPADITARLHAARQAEAQAEVARQAAEAALQGVVLTLDGPPYDYTAREIASMLDVSYQRIYRIVADAKPARTRKKKEG
jgi:hypothetical protein